MIAILAILSVITSSLLTLRIWRLFIQKNTGLNKIIVTAVTAFTFTIYFESYRLINYIYFSPIDDFAYQLYFVLSVFLILFSISIGLRAVFIFNRQSGHPITHEMLIRAMGVVLFIFISIINVFTFVPSGPNEINLSSYQMNPTLGYIMILLYLPLIIFVLYRTRIFWKEINEKKLSRLVSVFFAFFLSLSIERALSMCHFSSFPNTVTSLIADLVILNIALFGLLVVLYSNPNLLNRISSYFCVKSIFVCERRGGQVIYHHHFNQDVLVQTLTPNTLLLGGFIHAVSHGLKKTLRNGGEMDMETIKAGDITLLFKTGKRVLGLIFATELSSILPVNLYYFLQRFESTYESELETWRGDLKVFDAQLIDNWTVEIFR